MVHEFLTWILRKGKLEMKTLIFVFFATIAGLTISGCDSFVENVDRPINTIDDALLNDESQANFIITGVKSQFSLAYAQLSLFADGLSDALIFDRRVPGATFPQ